MMIRFFAGLAVLLLAAVVIGIPTATNALELFGVDIITDELVKIDSATGVITTVGDINYDLNESELTSLNGVIYAITSNSPGTFAGAGYTLVTIDPTTGHSLSAVNMTYNGSDIHAEGITAADGKLIIGYDHASLLSVRSAEVDPATAIVTNSQYHGIDIDGLATTLDGQMFGVDRNGTTHTFFTVERDPPGGSITGSFSYVGNTLDIVFAPSGAFGIDRVNSQLLKLDLSGSPTIVDTIPLTPNGANIMGLAYIVPEPSTFLLTALGLLGLAFYGWRRKR